MNPSRDPALPFLRVEKAIERALAKQPKVQAPKDAFCYICLEGEDGGKLMRGCACRGTSAGFVHLECLTELAIRKEASGDPEAAFKAWTTCANCKQNFEGALGVEMDRRFWRRYRSSQDLALFYNSTKLLAVSLRNNDEIDAANELLDEASNCVGNNTGMLMELKLLRAQMLRMHGQKIEALGRLQAMLPEAKVYTHTYSRTLQHLADVLLDLDRYQEAHKAAADAVTFAKAKFGLEDPRTLEAVTTYAVACAKLGRVEEAKATFDDLLITQTRVLGRDHPLTQYTVTDMRNLGFAVPSG